MSQQEAKIKFKPVFGENKKIDNLSYNDGYLYFATDTGKIYLDANQKRVSMGGGGVKVLYANALKVGENVDGSYSILTSDLEDSSSEPRQDDLIINKDGRFFKVSYFEKESGTIVCGLIAVSGTGGSTGPDGDSTASINLEVIKAPSLNYVYGQPSKISFKATSTEDYVITYTIRIIEGNQKQTTYKKTVNNGEIFDFDLGSVLPIGTNLIEVLASGANSGTISKRYPGVECIQMLLEESAEFNPLQVFSGLMAFKCRPIGLGLNKKLRIYIDDELYQTVNANNTGEDIEVDIVNLKHGSHKLRATLSTGEGALETFTNELNYEFAYVENGNPAPIIWLEKYYNKITQYENLNIKYKVYDPEKLLKTEVRLYINGNEIPASPLEVGYNTSNLKWEQWFLTKHEVGYNTYTIKCSNTIKNFEIQVDKDTERDLEIIETGLLLNLEASGRTNQENKTNRNKWSYTNKNNETINASLNNFNWYNNGWIIDKDYGSCLRVSNGASVKIPLNILNEKNLTNSLTFEFQFRIRNVQNYSTLVTNVTKEDSEGNVTVEKIINTKEGVCGSYFNQNIGLCIGTQEAFFKSKNETINARYKEDELINLSFVIENNIGGKAPLMYMYINGLMSSIASYSNDSFEANVKELVFNSDYCDIDIFKIRVYKTRLSQQNVVHNYAVDRNDIEAYDVNQIAKFENNIPQIDFNKMLSYNIANPDSPTMPYAIIKMTDGDQKQRLPYVKDENGRTCNIKFVNPSLDRAFELKEISDEQYIMGCPSFEATGVNINVQGTSSQGYPRRNYKAKFKKAKTWKYTDGPAKGSSLLEDITINEKTYKNYYMDNDHSENAFTWKADYMESSGTHNTGFTSFVKKLYSKHPLEDYMPDNYDPGQHRTTIYGFPMLVFQEFNDGSYEFIGKYNFNLDKSCPNVIGYTIKDSHPNIPGKTFEEVSECWEFCNNQGDRCSFTKVNFEETNFSGKLTVLDDFEVRYHKDSDDIEEAYNNYVNITEANSFILSKYENLRKVAEWLYSTDVQDASKLGSELESQVKYGETVYTHDTREYRLAKFANEFKDHFDEEYCFIYFIMTELLLMYDSRGKNCMFSSWGPQKPGGEYIWYPIFYDSDTQLGVNNSGVPTWDYFTEATATSQFSTSNSVLWNNLWACFSDKIKQYYRNLRNEAGKLNLEILNGYYDFNPNISESYAMKGSRPLIAYNIDEYYKYIAPTYDGYLNTSGDKAFDSGSFFYCLQGSRELQRELFLRNRFNFIDSEWLAGPYATETVMNEVWMRFNANAYAGTSDKFLDVDVIKEELVGKMESSPFGSNPLDATVQFNIKPYLDQFVSFYYDKTQFEPKKFDGENSVNLQLPEGKIKQIKIDENFTQQLLYVGGSEFISSLGDLSLCYIDEFKIPKAKRIKDITLGNDTPGYYNSLIKDNFSLDASAYNKNGEINENAKTLLESVVLTNMSSLTGEIDISGSEKIKTFRALGTAIKNIKLADGCQIETLHLPNSINSFELVEPVSLKNLITDKPINLTAEQMPKGIYIENVTDAKEFNSNSRTSIDLYSIIGGKLGYDSYKILNNLVKIKQQMQNVPEFDEKIYSKDLRIRLENIHWSPYNLVEYGESYYPDLIYKQKTDHYTFIDYVYNENTWNNDLLNGKIYIYEQTDDENLITDLSMLETFIESYENEDENKRYFKDTISGEKTLPYLSGDIYIANSTPISEAELKNIYKDKYFSDLNIFVKNVKESYTAKFIEILDNGQEKEWEVLKYEQSDFNGLNIEEINNIKPEKLHYVFKGWSTDPNAEVKDVLKEEDFANFNFEGTDIYTFYAIYEIRKYKIEFYNYNEEQLSSYELPYGERLIEPELKIIPYRDDSKLDLDKTYSFKGWTDNIENTSVSNENELLQIIKDISSYTANKDMKFYAVFMNVDVRNNVLQDKYLNFIENEEKTGYLISCKPTYSLTGKVTLPATHNNKPILGFSFNVIGAFEGQSKITHIFWEKNSKPIEIQSRSFTDCVNLLYFEFPTSIKKIYSYAFQGCSLINNNFSWENLEEIQDYAFSWGFGKLTERKTLYLGHNIISIGNQAFSASNVAFSNVELGDSENASKLNILGEQAFYRSIESPAIKKFTIYTEDKDKEIWESIEKYDFDTIDYVNVNI